MDAVNATSKLYEANEHGALYHRRGRAFTRRGAAQWGKECRLQADDGFIAHGGSLHHSECSPQSGGRHDYANGCCIPWEPLPNGRSPTSSRSRRSSISNTVVPLELGRKNRLAVLTVGPMLHRVGHAVIPAPGGDRIGPRPINYHLAGLQQMGAIVEERDGLYHFTTNGLKGATIALPYPSVMATETLIIAATLAQGKTVIQNAAIEPEIMDLIKFLQKMGAIIEQRVDRKIVIEGVSRLHGAEQRVLGRP